MSESDQPDTGKNIASYAESLKTFRSAAIDGTLATTAQIRSTAQLVGSGSHFCAEMKSSEDMLRGRTTLVEATGLILNQMGLLSAGERAQQQVVLAGAKDVIDSPATKDAKEACNKMTPGLFPTPGR